MTDIKKPIVNPASEKLVLAIIKKLPQSLLITGENGVGISTIARYIADFHKVSPMVILPEKDEKVDIDKGVIGIDAMRRLYDETRTKVTGKRIIIIDNAERMTHQAQNAFLKLLEEPNVDMYFILVSHSVNKLLPTIVSRAENLNMKPITSDQSNELLDSLGLKDDKKRSQVLFMAMGLPAELTRLAADKDYFDNRSATVRDARELLQGNSYHKLLIAQRYKDDRSSALLLLLDAANIINKSIVTNPQFDAINYIDKLLTTYQRIDSNVNIRLCLARMVI